MKAAFGQVALATFVSIFAAPLGTAQESDTYRIETTTVSSGAQAASSASFALTMTAAEGGVVGSISICNGSLLSNTGFWSTAGAIPAPVVLTVGRDEGDPSRSLLTWSGSSPEFTLYRATTSQGVVDPSHEVLVTGACSAVDSPPLAAVTYYMVEATGN